VKPQFEAGRAQVRGGVVHDPSIHAATIETVVEAATAAGLGARDVIASPILGPEGNREFLLHLRVGGAPGPGIEDRIAAAADAPGGKPAAR